MPVTCPTCGREFKGDRLNSRHISVCDPSRRKPVPACLCGHESTSLTQMKRHRRSCEVWEGRDRESVAAERRKKTNLERYGVEQAAHLPEVQVRREATCRERYGASNPLSRESSVYDKVQKALEGKRFVFPEGENPFSDPEVQEKIRATMLERYGAENPQQVPEIREATRQTNLERYGYEHILSVPEIRDQIRATCEERYGGPSPSSSPEVRERIQQTNLERYGVPWTCMDPEVRRKQLETMESKWGGHFFASEEGKETVRRRMIEKYGVWHPALQEGFWERNVETFRERYGVDHPLQLEEFLEKQRSTNEERYGTPFPGLCAQGPNLLERRVAKRVPELLFTGDGAYWRYLPLLDHHKNPDFILPGPCPRNPKKGVTKVVEVFGDYWHSRVFTGKAPFEHEQELIDAFEEIGIQCLVVWESEFNADPNSTSDQIREFLSLSIQ